MNSPKQQMIFEGKAHAGVMQDKAPQVRCAVASGEPYIPDEEAVHHQKPHGSEKRQTAHVSSRIPPHIKTGLLQVAKHNGWSESKVVATACEAYLEHDLGEKFGVRLAAQVTEAIAVQMHKERKENNRAGDLALEAFYSSEETRVFCIYLLRFLLGEDQELLPQIIKEVHDQARANVNRVLNGGEQEIKEINAQN
jgi:hypothetical protein